MKIIIAGGGIGGLAAAVALRKVGVEPLVLERAPVIREVGAGLSLWSNAVLALVRLGVHDALVPHTTRCDRMVTQSSDGEEIDDVDLTAIAERAGNPSIFAHRGELQRVLLEACGAERVRTGAAVVGFEQSDTGVRVRLEDGRVEEGDALIGADGLRSAVRSQLFGPIEEPRYAGYTGWRGIAPVVLDADHPTTSRFILGAGAQAGIHTCGEARTYWFLTHNGPAGGTDAAGGHHAAVNEVIAGWTSPLAAIVEATPEDAISRHDVYDRPPIESWGEGRVTLLGDSVHSTTPNLGQGACMALEDAVVLAHHLRGATSIPDALRAYEKARRERTAFVTNTSRRLGKMFQIENVVLRKMRDVLLSADFAHSQSVKSLEQLLVHDLPPLA